MRKPALSSQSSHLHAHALYFQFLPPPGPKLRVFGFRSSTSVPSICTIMSLLARLKFSDMLTQKLLSPRGAHNKNLLSLCTVYILSAPSIVHLCVDIFCHSGKRYLQAFSINIYYIYISTYFNHIQIDFVYCIFLAA